MTLLLIPLEALDQDLSNVRRRYDGIEELAKSIEQNGLLQNLVVESKPDGRFIVRAGNRRLLALRKLAAEDKWNEPVMCLVRDGCDLSQLVENIQRRDVSPLSLGHRYIEIIDSGSSIAELARQLGKGTGHISFHMNIAKLIHPDVQTFLERNGIEKFTKQTLSEFCRMVDPTTGEAILESQMNYAQRLTREKKEPGERKIRVKTRPADVVYHRLCAIRRNEVPMDPEMAPYVAVIVEYLDGITTTIRTPKARQ